MEFEHKDKDRVSKSDQAHERLSVKVREAADVVRGLIRSVKMELEERIAIEDNINGISRQAELMLDRIESVSREKQREMLHAYKKFLERNLEAVNQRLGDLK